MKLTFLGTRGEIEIRTRSHYRHSSLLVGYRRARVMIDCGADWLGRFEQLRPDALVITHAHIDHAGGLADGAPCPVYATAESWAELDRFPIASRRVVVPRTKVTICGLTFEAFPVEHSLRAPAVGYRITAGRASIFYSPDVVFIHDRIAALRGVRMYIGDGAAITQPLIRRRGKRLIGHTPIRVQIGWCRCERVSQMIVTHCGTQIVGSPQNRMRAQLAALGRQQGVDVRLAHDGMVLVLR